MTVTTRGTEQIVSRLARGVGHAIPVGLTAVAVEAQSVIAPYPGRSGKKQPFKSDKQRRFFFAALRKGRLTVPYRRSGDLGRSWKIVPRGPLTVMLVNTQRYANLVHGMPQAKYHKGTWTSRDEAVRQVRPRARRIFEDAIRAQVGG